MKFAIIASPLTNHVNVARLLRSCNFSVELYSKPTKIKNSEILVLSGNGSFGSYFNYLISNQWDQLIHECLNDNKPIVAICAGMQILSLNSDECPGIKGFGHFLGKFSRFEGKVHTNIGRRKIKFCRNTEFSNSEGFFCHSYYYIPNKGEDTTIIAKSEFSGIKFPALLKKKNVLGFQFHPELSGLSGSKLVKNILERLNDE